MSATDFLNTVASGVYFRPIADLRPRLQSDWVKDPLIPFARWANAVVRRWGALVGDKVIERPNVSFSTYCRQKALVAIQFRNVLD